MVYGVSTIHKNIGMQMYKTPITDKAGFWGGTADNDIRDAMSHLLDENFFGWRWDEMKGKPQEGKQFFHLLLFHQGYPVGLWNLVRARQGGMEGKTKKGNLYMIP